jgi:arginine decarboxylase
VGRRSRVVSDIVTLAAMCHDCGIPLIVDEPWGPHYPFHPETPPSAIRSGADISVGSIHKTMAGMEQASIMLMESELMEPSRLELCYDLFESTSPSVPILATIDATRRQFVQDGERILGEQLRLARRARVELAKIEGVRVMGPEVLDGKGRYALDETKVLFDIGALGINGYEAGDWLLKEHHISLALSGDRHLLATFVVGTDDRMLNQLVSAIRKLAKWASSKKASHIGRRRGMPRRHELAAETVMSPARAFFAPAERFRSRVRQDASRRRWCRRIAGHSRRAARRAHHGRAHLVSAQGAAGGRLRHGRAHRERGCAASDRGVHASAEGNPSRSAVIGVGIAAAATPVNR